MKKLIFTIFIWTLLIPNIYAHPGRTDANGCHTCKTNCAKWGLSDGEYHCHNGSTPNNSSNNSSSSNTTPSTPSISDKSKDNTLKKITIDGEDVTINDTILYQTKKTNITINVTPNDPKSTYEIQNKPLEIGTNKIYIIVTAEYGNQRTYTLSVTRNKLSNNTNLKIFIADKEIEFNNYTATIDVANDTQKITDIGYTYELEDTLSQIKTPQDDYLLIGENPLNFIVTAEDGTIATYKLIINKLAPTPKPQTEKPQKDNNNKDTTKTDNVKEPKTSNNILNILISLILIGSAGTGATLIMKKFI